MKRRIFLLSVIIVVGLVLGVCLTNWPVQARDLGQEGQDAYLSLIIQTGG